MGGVESKNKKWELALNAARKNLKYKRKLSLECGPSKVSESVEPLSLISEGKLYRDKEEDRKIEAKTSNSVLENHEKSNFFVVKHEKSDDENEKSETPRYAIDSESQLTSGPALPDSVTKREESYVHTDETDKGNDLGLESAEGSEPISDEENVNKPVVSLESGFCGKLSEQVIVIDGYSEGFSRDLAFERKVLTSVSSEDDSEVFVDALNTPQFSLEGSFHSADEDDKIAADSGAMAGMNRSAFTITRHRKIEVPAIDSNGKLIRRFVKLTSIFRTQGSHT